MHIGVHFVQPDGSFRAVGCFQGCGGELIEVAMLPVVEHPVQFLARGRIRTNHIGNAQARDVEGLGRGGETDAVLRYFFRQRGERRVGRSGRDDVAVNLVADDGNAVPPANVPEPQQFFPRPAPSRRVVGVAE